MIKPGFKIMELVVTQGLPGKLSCERSLNPTVVWLQRVCQKFVYCTLGHQLKVLRGSDLERSRTPSSDGINVVLTGLDSFLKQEVVIESEPGFSLVSCLLGHIHDPSEPGGLLSCIPSMLWGTREGSC